MKKNLYKGAIITSLIMSLCACNNANATTNNVESQAVTKDTLTENTLDNESQHISQKASDNVQAKLEEKDIAYEITTKGDYNELAQTMSELVQNADMICKIKVEKTTSFINEIAMIQTEITPVVEEVYKGSYNGEKLYVNGGVMSYEEYSQNEIIKEAVSGHENPEGEEDYTGKYVVQSVDGQYIFEEGEEYIFFAKETTDVNKYYSLYAYQGTFKIEDNEVCNEALQEDEELRKDIETIFASKGRSASSSVNVDEFVEELEKLK